MDQRQINIIGTQFLQAFFQTGDQFVFTEIFDPDLGGDEQLVTCNTTFSDGLTDSRFVVIDLCGINGAIAQFQCCFNGSDNNIIFQAKSTKAKCRDCLDFPLYYSIWVN